MYDGISLISTPPVWVKPDQEHVEQEIAQFLSGEEVDIRLSDDKFEMDDSNDSPF